MIITKRRRWRRRFYFLSPHDSDVHHPAPRYRTHPATWRRKEKKKNRYYANIKRDAHISVGVGGYRSIAKPPKIRDTTKHTGWKAASNEKRKNSANKCEEESSNAIRVISHTISNKCLTAHPRTASTIWGSLFCGRMCRKRKRVAQLHDIPLVALFGN